MNKKTYFSSGLNVLISDEWNKKIGENVKSFFESNLVIFSKKIGETIVIENDIYLTILGMNGNEVRLGVDAPSSTRIKNEKLQSVLQFESHCKATNQSC